MSLEITEVNVNIVSAGKILAFANIVFNNAFRVDGFKVIDGQKGLFIGMPSQKVKEEYKDIAYPINKESRELITEAILNAYDKQKGESKSGSKKSSKGKDEDPF
jgi:stage V sporulation protein G